jgi:hypothetical protein
MFHVLLLVVEANRWRSVAIPDAIFERFYGQVTSNLCELAGSRTGR